MAPMFSMAYVSHTGATPHFSPRVKRGDARQIDGGPAEKTKRKRKEHAVISRGVPTPKGSLPCLETRRVALRSRIEAHLSLVYVTGSRPGPEGRSSLAAAGP
jgi:hypothetical protein